MIAAGLGVLSVLGLSSLGMHEKGLRAERQQEFITVAEKVRFDVKKKLDTFLATEQSRAYTDYQYYYVPMADNQAAALVRSPLGGALSNGLAYGYFQLDSTSQIVNPYAVSPDRASSVVKDYVGNLERNLLPALGNGESLQVTRIEPSDPKEDSLSASSYPARTLSDYIPSIRGRGAITDRKANEPTPAVKTKALESETPGKAGQGKKVASKSKSDSSRRSRYPIDLEQTDKTIQVQNRSRGNFYMNEAYNVANSRQQQEQVMLDESDLLAQRMMPDMNSFEVGQVQREQFARQKEQILVPNEVQQAAVEFQGQMSDVDIPGLNDVVQVRIEPFTPITVADDNGDNGVFAGQVFLLRHVQIEDQHLLQGFRLDERELLRQVSDSTQQFLRRGMGFDISKAELPEAAYTAVLDFGFGEVVLNLLERQPDWIMARVTQIRNWFFAILAIVWLAVIVALATFWRNMYEQVQLSRKKDDFISAVSHELRTPLTSIRMYTEMLEKDWVKTDGKRKEYYSTMRQESERLTRLIENVLDFSRIQRGKKRYEFTMGNVNTCIDEVVEMMRPYADRAGFTLLTEFEEVGSFSFDRDAVVQIVINLLDNALKYAREADDKFILVRTCQQKDYVVIEVEDHGPGIARSQQKKIFDAFYRCGDESTRQATGTGLGLALVKRFAEAHHGFVEIVSAKPTGALFRVGLANHYGK